MQITVSGRHLDITDSIHQYAVEKAGKLPRYYDRVTAIEVVAGKGDSHTYAVEMVVHVAHHDHFVGKAHGDDLYRCIDETADKIER